MKKDGNQQTLTVMPKSRPDSGQDMTQSYIFQQVPPDSINFTGKLKLDRKVRGTGITKWMTMRTA